jgi:ubiquinone/menaquinone biosynthesis C-methylase UbiE
VSTTTSENEAVAQLKEQHRATWAIGDYAAVAELIDEVPPSHLLAAVGIASHHDVLDVATGSGNVALRAARSGARVTGLDLTPELLDVARTRAAADGLGIEFAEGDCEALPYGDESYDRVLSVFGVQFAPRHRVTADELVRVTRPGGVIGLVNWTPQGLIGRMFRVFGKYMPAPPAFASAPPLWGDEDHVSELFAEHDVTLEFERATTPFVFPSIEEYQRYFEERYGPTIKTKAKLEADGTWDAARAELMALYAELNEATDGSSHIESEYLLTVARKA